MSCSEKRLEDDYNINPVPRYRKTFPAIVSIILTSIYFGIKAKISLSRRSVYSRCLKIPLVHSRKRFRSTESSIGTNFCLGLLILLFELYRGKV
ncbi:hypothetical protein CEXT_624551 [Caerostris extrusa]|uniref:Uncharacterized protein n=1 Tax=Caerostris extrusa TaxID=172846 RepID=A0AAV4MRI3_CAEEX|nr:hypothetical protein CEXT_624551 [Caerostris extrusa]